MPKSDGEFTKFVTHNSFVFYSSELAILANKKNTDQHIVLLGRSPNLEDSDVAVIEFDRDKWLPRIDLQGKLTIFLLFLLKYR